MIHHSVVAKKRLGQNFLHDPNVIRRIVDSLELGTTDVVLEIGCGTGALTRHLAAKPRQFIGVEVDQSLFKTLKDQAWPPSVLFLNQDILQLDMAELLHTLGQTLAKVKIVGNLPYYISSPIIEWLGKQSRIIDSATIMLQSEVADRLTASPGTKQFGVLSLIASYHFTATKLMEVRPGAFRPVPKVSSTVVTLRPKARPVLEIDTESALFAFIKQSFSQRRKTLWNCLKGSVNKDRLGAMLESLGHSADSRAEVLSLQDFISLFTHLGPSSLESK